jgi:hypothetical protein
LRRINVNWGASRPQTPGTRVLHEGEARRKKRMDFRLRKHGSYSWPRPEWSVCQSSAAVPRRPVIVVQTWLAGTNPLPTAAIAPSGVPRTIPEPFLVTDPMKADLTLLRAALVGYETRLAQVNDAIQQVRQALSSTVMTSVSQNGRSSTPKHQISAAGRNRIAAAQRRRWAAYRKQKP